MTLSQRAALHTGIERRSCAFQLAGIEVRGAGSPALSGWTLEAYASVTNTPYVVHDEFGPFTETVRRGAFGDTLAKGPDVAFRVNHEGLALGRTRSGTLHLDEDARGLKYSVNLDPDSPNAVALRSAVNRRDVTESSFAFLVTSQEWSSDYLQRSIFGVDLDRGDVSAVTFGASPSTGDEGNATTLRAATYDRQVRAKYNTDDLKALKAKGHTFPGTTSYPIDDEEDLDKAIHAVGRGGADHDAIRKYIAARAKAMGFSSKIPDNWNADGSLKGANAAGRFGESRSPLHGQISGSHTHSHPANGSQGSWKTHTHTHSHDGDASHDHSHDAAAMIADADTSGQSMDQPSAEALGLPNFDVESRIRILRLKVPPPAPLTSSEKFNRALAAGAEADRTVARRLARTKGKR